MKSRQSVPMWIAALALLLACASLPVHAQRDPTQPPPEASVSSGGAASQSPLGTDGMAVVVRNGKPFLVIGTRLYAPGQKVGQQRVERITETEVWLRDSSGLKKIPRFAGIQRTVAAPVAAHARAASAPRAAKNLKKAIAP